MKKIDCEEIVKGLRGNKYLAEKVDAIEQAKKSKDLWEKCVLLRVYTSPQSTDAEKIIKRDLELKNAADNNSGDGIKNGIKYEIKVSVHDVNCKVNIRQIRPHHSIDFYIIVAFNLFGGTKGEAYVFKIPANVIYELVVKYGGYTHGTVSKNGKVNLESISDINTRHEYSLTADPNAADGTKSKKLWDNFLEYKVDYTRDSF
jgi:hypothetical protein